MVADLHYEQSHRKQEVGRNFLYFRMYRIIYPCWGGGGWEGGGRSQGNGLPCFSVANTSELLFSGRVSGPAQSPSALEGVGEDWGRGQEPS